MVTYTIVQLDASPKDDEVVAQRLKVIDQYFAEMSKKNGNTFIFRTPHSAREDLAGVAQEIKELVPQADFLLALRESVPASVITLSNNLLLIQKLGLWPDTIDLEAAIKQGIPVAVSPHQGLVTVAEHTMLLILALSRRLIPLHQAAQTAENPRQLAPIHTTQWQRYFNWLGLSPDNFVTLSGKTLGLVGLGEIGGEVAKRARAFGMDLIYTKRHQLPREQEEALVASYVSLDELLQHSDVISLQIPHNSSTEKLIGERELALMKPSAFLINTSRGNVVDEEALIQFLQEKRIAGAGLDVFSTEPLQPDNPLTQLENVVLSPHVGAVTSTLSRYQRAFDNFQRIAEGLPPLDRVV